MLKYCLPLFVTLTLMLACEPSQKQPETPAAGAELPQSQVKTLTPQILKNYFLLNSIKVEAPTSAWLPGDLAQLRQTLGVAQIPGSVAETPNFFTDFVAVLATPATNKLTNIRIAKIEENGDAAYVHFEVTTGAEITWTIQPALVFTFPRSGAVKTVHFMYRDSTIQSLPTSTAAVAPVDTSFTALPVYFLRQSVQVSAPVSCWVIGEAQTFNQMLSLPPKDSTATTPSPPVRAPDFAKEIAVAVAAPDTKKFTEIRITKAEIKGTDLNVTFSILEGGEQSTRIRPFAMAAVPHGAVKTVHFFNGSKKVKSLRVTSPLPPSKGG